MSVTLRRLAVSVCSGRVAAVFVEGDKVVALKMSRTAAQNPQSAARIIGSWITGFRPDHLIAEKTDTARRKGNHTKTILEAIATLFEEADGLNMQLPRIQSYQNKYAEAKALAAKYPEVSHIVPKQPPIWIPEPRNLSYFEALSFVEQLNT